MLILAQPLSQLFNFSLSLGLFPDSRKMARVATVSKHGTADERCDYRPNSVLQVASRLFQTLIYDQLRHYLPSNKHRKAVNKQTDASSSVTFPEVN